MAESEYRLPAVLVEKMAEALKTWMVVNHPIFDEDELYSVDYEDMVAAVTGVLLDECGVRERYQLVGKGRGLSSAGWVEFLGDDLAFARRAQADEPDAALMRRLQLTAPLEPVDPPLVAPFVRLEGPPGEEPG